MMPLQNGLTNLTLLNHTSDELHSQTTATKFNKLIEQQGEDASSVCMDLQRMKVKSDCFMTKDDGEARLSSV